MRPKEVKATDEMKEKYMSRVEPQSIGRTGLVFFRAIIPL